MNELPIISRAIDNTALSTYMKCPREYNLSMRQGWRAKESSQALSFGALWHTILEWHYKSGGSLAAVMEAFANQEGTLPDTGDYRSAQRAMLDYKKYLKKYDAKKDCAQTVGFPDNPLVELSTAVYSKIIGHEYAGKIDRVIVDSTGNGFVEDHKTTSRLDRHYFRQFENSNQMMGYVWIARQLVPDVRIIGVRINVSHVLTSKTEFYRHPVTFSDARLDEWEKNTAMWMRRMEDSIKRDEYPAHFGDNGCTHKFGRCQFYDVCAASSTIRQELLEQQYVVQHWDPLADAEATSE